MKPSRVDLTIAAAFCGVVGLYDTLYVLSLLAGGPLIRPKVDVLFPDFLVFHGAVRASVVYLAPWLMPTYGLVMNRIGLPLMPLIILLFGVVAWARLKAQHKVELPRPAATR